MFYVNGTVLRPVEKPWRIFLGVGVSLAALAVIAVLVWQGIFAHGAPDPTQPHTSATVAALDIGVLVFREGLECILVLAAITASMTGAKRAHRKPVAAGAGVAFGATLLTWVIAVQLIDSLSDNMRALDLQAATGLLAVVVLLVIMNWFFHKIYWGGWIRAHNRRRKHLLEDGHGSDVAKRSLLWGLILLGFTSLYREGFEVVLFLQTYHLRFGGGVVLQGALLGIALSGKRKLKRAKRSRKNCSRSINSVASCASLKTRRARRCHCFRSCGTLATMMSLLWRCFVGVFWIVAFCTGAQAAGEYTRNWSSLAQGNPSTTNSQSSAKTRSRMSSTTSVYVLSPYEVFVGNVWEGNHRIAASVRARNRK